MDIVNPGLATVTTDGVTIQGNGTAASPVAIKAVQVDGVTITGAGTVASPLSAAAQAALGWPLTWWPTQGAGNATIALASTANTISLFGFALPAQIQFNKILVVIGTGDNTNNSDIGIYTYAGALVAHIGAQHLGTTGLISPGVVGGPITLNPGRYYLGTTSVATTATLNYSNNAAACISFLHSISSSTSTGGALPTPITPPADSPIANVFPIFALSI